MSKVKKWYQFKSRVAHGLARTVVLFSLVVAVVAIAIEIFHDYHNNIRAIYERIEQVETGRLNGIAASVWTFNHELTQLQIDGIHRLEYLEYVAVKVGNKLIVEAGEEISERNLRFTMPLKYEFVGASKSVGKLLIVVGLDAFYERILNKAVSILVHVSLIIVVVIGFLYFIVQRKLTRHLEALAGYASSIQLENLSDPIKYERLDSKEGTANDEFDDIADSLFEMQKNLKQAYDELVEHQEQLEETVVERTRHLEEQITERKFAEASLLQSQARFKDIADVSSDFIWETDSELKYTYISPKFFSLTQFQSSDIVGRYHQDLLGKKYSDSSDEAWQKHLACIESHRPFSHLQTTVRAKNGERMYLEISGKPVFDESGSYQGYRGAARDVTSQKLAEIALKESERSLLDMLDNSPFGVVIVSHDKRVPRYANKRIGELFEEDMFERRSPEDWKNTYHEPSDWKHHWDQIGSDGIVEDFEELRINKTGKQWWSLSNWRKVSFLGEETVMSWYADISDLKEMQEKLQESEKRLRGIFNTGAAGMTLARMDGSYSMINERFCEITGYAREEILKMNWRDITVPEDIGPIEELDRKVVLHEADSYSAERRILNKNGDMIWTTITSAHLRDRNNESEFMYCFVQDVTDFKIAEEKLRRNAELSDLLRVTAVEANRSGSFHETIRFGFHKIGEMAAWHPKNLYLLSQTNDSDLVSFAHDDLDGSEAFHWSAGSNLVEDHQDARKLLLSAVKSGEPVIVRDLKKLSWIAGNSKQSLENFVHILVPILSQENVIAVMHFCASDEVAMDENMRATLVQICGQFGRVYEREVSVKQIHAAMKEIDEINQSLEQKVTKRTYELNEAKQLAEKASQAKTDFLANMSHELRTPLNAIIGFSQMIKDNIFGPVQEQYQSYANDIFTSGEHLLGIISDILDLSKVESGELGIDVEEVDLADIVSTCDMMIGERAIKAKVNLKFDVSKDLPRVYADPLRLKQILLNIIGNAVKFTPADGAVTVSCKTPKNRPLEISIRDTGVGIAEEDLPIIVEKFGQVRDGHTHAHEGAGLGLAIAKSLIELHEGQLLINSKLGEGTEVKVIFPEKRIVSA